MTIKTVVDHNESARATQTTAAQDVKRIRVINHPIATDPQTKPANTLETLPAGYSMAGDAETGAGLRKASPRAEHSGMSNDRPTDGVTCDYPILTDRVIAPPSLPPALLEKTLANKTTSPLGAQTPKRAGLVRSDTAS